MTSTYQTSANLRFDFGLTDVQRIALGLVWLAIASSAIVFSEPAPVDVLMLGVIAVLPLLGLVRITPPLMLYFTIWMVAASSALIAVINADDPSKALVHSLVTVFLTVQSFVVSAFVMRRPYKHMHLIMHAYCCAAGIAAVVALIGYFNVLPGSFDLFTKYGRASGTFKDPNVFGPFLAAPVVYLLHRMLTRGPSTLLWGGIWAGIMSIALMLSFSRGAWMVLVVSTTLFAYLAFVTAPNNWQRLKIITAGFMALCAGLVLLVGVMQIEGIAEQFSSRATLTQSYDEGPEGRFGGQQKAKRLIIETPLGIGAQQFAPHHHSEEPHNVYLAMFLNAGWVGGLIFAIMVGLTCLYGLRHAFKRTATQPLFLVAYSCFVAHAIEGFVIDLDHWRHFHLLMALVWGLMLGDREIQSSNAGEAGLHDAAGQTIFSPRAPRIMTAGPVMPRMFRRAKPTARREAGRGDSRPNRATGRTYRRRVP